MTTYVLASRRLDGSRARLAASQALDDVVQRLLRKDGVVLGETKTEGEFGRHVVVLNVDASKVEAERHLFPKTVLVERAIPHETARSVGFRILGEGQPLADARVLGFISVEAGTPLKLGAVTDSQGFVHLELERDESVVDTLVIRPFGGFWSMVVPDPSPGSTIACEKLPPGPGGWWHELLGVDPESALGTGIRVGVIDTGVGPHPCVKCIDLGVFLDGGPPTFPGTDHDGHGTHVAGLIGATATEKAHYAGIATLATMASARVFGEAGKANQGDIANALDALSEDFEAHIVNMSLAAKEGSEILHEAVQDAFDRGTVCVCAAGNTAGPVEYPAAFPESIAVAALGKQSWGARGSLATLQRPAKKELHGDDDLYLATFSCYGQEIFCAAPGVGIISTLPSASGAALFAEMDGTSMASPLVSGVLAGILAEDAAYLAAERGRTRAERARALLSQRCRPVGLPSLYCGHGCPRFVASR
jgi:hypothetical protein